MTPTANGVNAKAMRKLIIALSVLFVVVVETWLASNPAQAADFSNIDQQRTHLGQNGSTINFSLTPQTNNSSGWACFTVISNATFAFLNSDSITGAVAGITFPAGVTIFGTFTNYCLTNGCIITYNAKRGE